MTKLVYNHTIYAGPRDGEVITVSAEFIQVSEKKVYLRNLIATDEQGCLVNLDKRNEHLAVEGAIHFWNSLNDNGTQ